MLPASAYAQSDPANCSSNQGVEGGCVAPTLVEGEKGGGTQGFMGFQISFDTKQGLAPKFVAGLRHTECRIAAGSSAPI